MNAVVTDEALADLANIQDSIAERSPQRANTFVDEILDCCESLCELAMAFPLVPRYEDRGIRPRPHGRYSIFYRIVSDDIVVIHILNGARDCKTLLFPDREKAAYIAAYPSRPRRALSSLPFERFQPRPYCRGVIPITLLNAVLNALSDS